MTLSPKFNSFKQTLPSALSFLRGVLGIIAPLLIFSDNRVIHLAAGILFIFAVITDYWDGYFARRFGSESDFGKILDPLMDKVLILSAMIVFAVFKFYSPWWLVPIFFREITATFFRAGWLLEGKAVGAEKIGKIKFFFQAITIGAAYLYFLSFQFECLKPVQTGSRAAMYMLLVISLVLTVISGISFVRKNWIHCQSENFARFSSALCVGLIPYAPGTWGSALGVVLFLLIFWNVWLQGAVLVTLIWFGWWAVSKLDLSREKDPCFVVVDETCGMLISLIGFEPRISTLLIGFLLFRLFDIVKPFPLRRLERLPGYWGILCDDLGAGVYTWLILKFILHA